MRGTEQFAQAEELLALHKFDDLVARPGMVVLRLTLPLNSRYASRIGLPASYRV